MALPSRKASVVEIVPGRGSGAHSPRDRLRRHIEQKLKAARLEMFPFPHLVISEFFPPAIFARMQEFNLFRSNEGVEWIKRDKMTKLVTPTPYDHRFQVNFHDGSRFEATPAERGFWRMITSVFLADTWFPRLVYHKFPSYFDVRFGEAVRQRPFWRRLRHELFLQRHEPGYHIGPHTDVPTRVFTCIFSLADRPGFDEFGTQLLRHKDPRVRCSGRQHYGFEDFEVVKTAPYVPNSFLLFFKTRQSFHAVKSITPAVPNGRYGMQYQLYEPPGGVFRDLSHPDLMENKHVRPEEE